MVRFIHTADWHLGRSFFGYSLLEDQAHALDRLVRLTAEEKCDVLLVAGDVFDRAVPPAEAVTLLDETLTRLVEEAGTRVVLIGGNHDSQRRLEFGSRLVDRGRLLLAGRLRLPLQPLRLRDRWGEVGIWPLPWTHPTQVRSLLGEETGEGGTSALAALVGTVTPGPRDVLVLHAFLRGGLPSESERPLGVGGEEQVSPEICAPFAYTALGHLHRPQSVGGCANIRYSGSLLQYSFAEVGQEKGVSRVEIDGAGKVRVDHLPLPPRRPLAILEGKLEELLARAGTEGGGEGYTLARLTDRGPVLQAAERLRPHYPNLVHVERAAGPGAEGSLFPVIDSRRADTEELFRRFFHYATGAEMEAAEQDLLRRVLGRIEALPREEEARR